MYGLFIEIIEVRRYWDNLFKVLIVGEILLIKNIVYLLVMIY